MTYDAKTNKLFRCIVHIVRNDNRCNRQIRFETDQIHVFSSYSNHLFLSLCNYTYEQNGTIQSRKMCINTPIDIVHRCCCCCCCCGRCFCVIFFCLSTQIYFRYTLFRWCNRALESNSKTPRSYYVFQPIPPQIAEQKIVLFYSHFSSPSHCVFSFLSYSVNIVVAIFAVGIIVRINTFFSLQFRTLVYSDTIFKPCKHFFLRLFYFVFIILCKSIKM